MSLGNTSSISGALLLSQVRRTHVINLWNLDKSEARSESEILIRRFRHRHVSCVHQQLSKFSETTDLSGMVWNGLEWSEVSEMSEMSKMSNSLDT